MNEACQIGREEIALGADATGAHLPALRAGFLLDAATVARLGESRAPGVDRDDGPASARSQAGQPLDQHARRTELDRLPVGLLPRPIRELFQLEGAAHPQHPMGQLPVTALARGRELAVEFAPPGLHLPLAFGDLPALRASLDPAPLVVVGRVVGPALPVELPVQPPQRFRVGSHLRTERLQERGLQGRHCDGRGTQIQPHDPAAQVVLRLLVRRPLAHQLGGEAIPLAQLAADQAHVLHRAGESVGLHRIVRIQPRLKLQSLPLDSGPAPAEAARIRLALDGVQLVPALEPDPARLPHEQPIGGAVGPTWPASGW